MNLSYYDFLAEDYNHKRQKPWKALQEFLTHIDTENWDISQVCLDIGCGNGRNFPLISSISNQIIGIDNSIELLKIARKNIANQMNNPETRKRPIQLILSSISSIPIRSKIIDGAFIVAVIHHIKGTKNRKSIINQIYEIIKINGWVIVSVWRKYQKKYRWYFIKDLIKRIISSKYRNSQKRAGLVEFGDKSVPWTLSKEGKTYLRFYHFFSFKEAKCLMNHFKIVEMNKIGGPGKKDNFFFLLKKTN